MLSQAKHYFQTNYIHLCGLEKCLYFVCLFYWLLCVYIRSSHYCDFEDAFHIGNNMKCGTLLSNLSILKLHFATVSTGLAHDKVKHHTDISQVCLVYKLYILSLNSKQRVFRMLCLAKLLEGSRSSINWHQQMNKHFHHWEIQHFLNDHVNNKKWK